MTDNEKFKSPYSIAIIDLLDAYHYADVFEDDRFAVIARNFIDLDKSIALADRLFRALNPDSKSQEEWCEYDDGFDVRIYDSEAQCAYKAHERLPETRKDYEIEKSIIEKHGSEGLMGALSGLPYKEFIEYFKRTDREFSEKDNEAKSKKK